MSAFSSSLFGGEPRGNKAIDDGQRSFTVEASSIDETGGRYINQEPLQAAKKAANVLFSSPKGKKQNSIKLELRETTRGSPDKLFAYQAKREKIDKTVEINGKKVTFHNRIKLSKVPKFFGDGARIPKSDSSY